MVQWWHCCLLLRQRGGREGPGGWSFALVETVEVRSALSGLVSGWLHVSLYCLGIEEKQEDPAGSVEWDVLDGSSIEL